MGIHIIWPEDRIVPEDTILTRHADAIANGELPANSHTEDALKAAQELEHIGQITLGKLQSALIRAAPGIPSRSGKTAEIIEPPIQAVADLLSTLMENGLQKISAKCQPDWPGIEGDGYETGNDRCYVIFDHNAEKGTLQINVAYDDESEHVFDLSYRCTL